MKTLEQLEWERGENLTMDQALDEVHEELYGSDWYREAQEHIMRLCCEIRDEEDGFGHWPIERDEYD
jgi:hypothetical protein